MRRYWHHAARAQRVRISELEQAESSLSDELLEEGTQRRHWQQVASDSRDHINELEAKLQIAEGQLKEMMQSLRFAAESFWQAHRAMHAAIPSDCEHIFFRDFAGHTNLMGGLGDPDYLLPNGLTVRHIDRRAAGSATRPRKAKDK